jgi:hypothetical protein
MSQNKLVSVKNVLVNLMDDLGLQHNKHTPMFVNWAILAEKKIGSYYAKKKKVDVLTIDGCTADLPCDCEYLQVAILGDVKDCCTDILERGFLCFNAEVGSTFANQYDLSSFLIVDLGGTETSSNTVNFGFVRYEVQDNKIIFLNNYDGQKVTIQYLGVETDCDGIPYVGENHLEAIGEFCMWKYKRNRIKSGIDIGIVDRHKREWEQLCADARATDAVPSESERRMIVEKLSDPFAGQGLYLGMHSTLDNWL